jgi:esterase/lipase superfamily enzyme
MTQLSLYYVTNRNHVGKNRWRPEGYGTKFSNDGIENLRFGRVHVDVDDAKVSKFLKEDMDETGIGDGEGLSDYLSERASIAKVQAYPEKINPKLSEKNQHGVKLGSQAMLSDLRQAMLDRTDVLVYVHGFNVSWPSAVGSALSLQTMLNQAAIGDPKQKVLVVLFTWPSDGLALPFVSYKSDRAEAAGSGNALGRALLKLRDYLTALAGEEPCGQDIHLLCHSMGNYLLQNALHRMELFTPGNSMARLFQHVFLCAADVDDTVLEPGQPLSSVHELTRQVSVYHNRGDIAMYVSDYTKGNPERLGCTGAARPTLLHHKISQIDCTPVASGKVEHSYNLTR